MKFSKRKEDYLKIILKMSPKNALLPVKIIAESLDVSISSAKEMIESLVKEDLVTYEAYRGVRLTKKGLYEASFILKTHQVWECFLVKILGYEIEEVHAEAELLEHANSRKLTERLYNFLKRPKTCPHGRGISKTSFWNEEEKRLSLNKVKTNEEYIIDDLELELVNYLNELELAIPKEIKIIKILQDKSLLVSNEENLKFTIPPFLQKKSIVKLKEV